MHTKTMSLGHGHHRMFNGKAICDYNTHNVESIGINAMGHNLSGDFRDCCQEILLFTGEDFNINIKMESLNYIGLQIRKDIN